MLSLTSDAILVLNSSGDIDFANARFLRIEGYELDDIAGKCLSEVPFTLVDDEVMEKAASSPSGEIFEKEIPVETADGSQIFRTKCIRTVLPDGGGATTLIFEDITQRRECQAQLRMKEALYRAVVEDQTEFIIRYRPDRTITFVNDAYCRAFGIDRLEVIGTVFAPSIPAAYQKNVSSRLSGLTPDDPVVSFANPVIMPDGSEAWHQWTNRGIFTDSGTLVGYQSVGRDITEQMRIQKAKCDLVEDLTLLSDFSGGLVMLSEEDSISLYAAEYLRKVAPSSLLLFFSLHGGFYHFHEVLCGDDRGNTNPVAILDGAKGMRFPCSIEIARRISPPNLKPFSPDCAAQFCTSFGDAAGRAFDELLQKSFCLSMGIISGSVLLGTCIVVSETNIESRSVSLIETIINQAAMMIQNRNMLESLRLTEKRYESLLDHSGSMIGIHAGGKILYANTRLREFLGIPLNQDVEMLSFSGFIHPDDLDFVTDRMIHVYSKGEVAPPMEERLIDADGTVKKVVVYSFPTVYHGEPGSQFVIQPLSRNG
ncbi:PAS domain S-box protein [Methanogenium sp. S4BF]|uniref:PAS domain-containing protein n=1 Tax=Methanogenium sp. S4BF TaxID=1789226 RepID=UPI002416525F|nr:PAS domain S-box protein [Methanogenium sp. S4BF]WFN35581.1 PAS domain S-box protein [Methanogenium sp. S4BF]